MFKTSRLIFYNMEIVQLSDIHVGSQFREETFQNVIDEINS